LASQKGFWAQVLGVGDFYFELGVQVITVAMATKATNGGIMRLDELLGKVEKIRKLRGAKTNLAISGSDVKQAITKLAVLGNGFRLSKIGGEEYLISVPMELSSDQTMVLEIAGNDKSSSSRVTMEQLQRDLKWDDLRCERALTALAGAGMAWFDRVDKSYWFPSLMRLEGNER
jgi:ESCRT-II complex subunit VPS22